MKEKIIVCQAGEIEYKIQPYLDQGWKVKSVTSENVAVSVAVTERNYPKEIEMRGKMIFILHTTP